MQLATLIRALAVAVDTRLARHRPGGWHNDDGDLSGAQQLALTAVGIAIIVGILYPLLSAGLSGAVSNMLAKLSGL